GGMKLGCTKPCRSRPANQRQSLRSVFLPRNAFTCSGFAIVMWTWSSRMLKIGFQYEPVLSIITSVHPFSNSHARHCCKSRTVVRNRRTSSVGLWWAGPISMQTSMYFFPTSIPAQRSSFTSSMASPSNRSRRLNNHFASRAWELHSEVRSRRPDQITQRGYRHHNYTAISVRLFNVIRRNVAVKRAPFSSSEVPAGHGELSADLFGDFEVRNRRPHRV